LLDETKILACQTCPRYAANPGHETTNGAALGEEIKALLSPGDQDNVRIVNGLAGCNIALSGPGKLRLRFSRLGPGDGGAVIDAAKAYAICPDGNLDAAQLPTALRDRLTAKSPPRIGA